MVESYWICKVRYAVYVKPPPACVTRLPSGKMYVKRTHSHCGFYKVIQDDSAMDKWQEQTKRENDKRAAALLDRGEGAELW